MGQPFGANEVALYDGQGLKGHTAEDYGFGWGQPVPNCAKDAYCYSVMNKDNANPMKYRAVFTLVEGDNGLSDWSEISYGHASDILAVPGQIYQPGDVLMKCGNTGDVYAFGQYVTKEQKLAGSKAGAHLHGPQVRPVRKVKKRDSKKNYLTDANGYLKLNGDYFEIVDYKNGYAGCINPGPFYAKQVVKLPPGTSVTFEKALAFLKESLTGKRLADAEAVLRKKYGR